jgi:hypothetical protein
MQRVKVVRRPLSDYLRYQFAWTLPGNVAAGEDYRILGLTGRSSDLPEQDFWLFDDVTVLLLNFNVDGRPILSIWTSIGAGAAPSTMSDDPGGATPVTRGGPVLMTECCSRSVGAA